MKHVLKLILALRVEFVSCLRSVFILRDSVENAEVVRELLFVVFV